MIKLIKNKKFKDLTTFKIGGKIKYYAEVGSESEIKEVFDLAEEKKLPVFILGGGSDFLASDKIFEGLVVRYLGNVIKFETQDSEILVTAEAGVVWDKLVEEAVKRNLQGLECLSGIPGTVGASPIQNIGAYGSEMADCFYKLLAYDIKNRKYITFTKNMCSFGYRESIFKNEKYWQKYLIVSVTFRLNKNADPKANYESLSGQLGENPTIADVRNIVLKVRKEKLENPKDHGNAGSFFKNPIINDRQKNNLQKKFSDARIFSFGRMYKVSAAWLIEKTDWKGKSLGGAAVSSKHSLILINKSGKASARDIYNLSEIMIKDIFEKTGIKLEREVQLVNF